MRSISKIVLFAVVLAANHAMADESVAKQTLLNGRISMLVPTGFASLSDAAKREKYPGANAPANVLSNSDGSTNLAFDQKEVQFRPEDIVHLEAALRSQFVGAKINSGGVRKLNGMDFLVFDVDTPAPDGTIRNIMAFTSLDNRLLAISYNCTVSRDKTCGELGHRIIDSIVVNSQPAAH